MLMADMIYKGKIDKARMQVRIEELYKTLESEPKSAFQRVYDMYTDFERLVFNMSKSDKINSVEDFKKMSTYAFYTYKTNLTEYLKPKDNGGN